MGKLSRRARGVLQIEGHDDFANVETRIWRKKQSYIYSSPSASSSSSGYAMNVIGTTTDCRPPSPLAVGLSLLPPAPVPCALRDPPLNPFVPNIPPLVLPLVTPKLEFPELANRTKCTIFSIPPSPMATRVVVWPPPSLSFPPWPCPPPSPPRDGYCNSARGTDREAFRKRCRYRHAPGSSQRNSDKVEFEDELFRSSPPPP